MREDVIAAEVAAVIGQSIAGSVERPDVAVEDRGAFARRGRGGPRPAAARGVVTDPGDRCRLQRRILLQGGLQVVERIAHAGAELVDGHVQTRHVP